MYHAYLEFYLHNDSARPNEIPSDYRNSLVEFLIDGLFPRMTADKPSYATVGVMVSNISRINEVNQRRAWLVLGWVSIFGRVNHLGM